jgi:hypothetical protein
MRRRIRCLDWLFRNRQTGRITIGQAPNLEQLIFSTTAIVGTLLPRSTLRTGLGVVSVLALAAWATDELVRGVNPFRRMLGAATLGGIVCLASGDPAPTDRFGP